MRIIVLIQQKIANELHSDLTNNRHVVRTCDGPSTWVVIITCVRTASEMDFQCSKKTSLTPHYALKEFIGVHIISNSNG